jgi:hypothetical protein
LKQFQEAIACVSHSSTIHFIVAKRAFVYVHRKYRYMELNLSQRRKALDEKIPDIKKTLGMVRFLQERRVCCILLLQWYAFDKCAFQEGKPKASEEDEDDLDEDLEGDSSLTSRKPLTTTFELNDTLHAEAELDDTDVVYLWLGVRCRLPIQLIYSRKPNSYPDTGKRDAILCTPRGYRASFNKTCSGGAESRECHPGRYYSSCLLVTCCSFYISRIWSSSVNK